MKISVPLAYQMGLVVARLVSGQFKDIAQFVAMTPQDSQTYLQLQQLISESLSRIAIALEHMIPPQAAPNYQFALDKFATMDWESIGAVVADYDSDGVSTILWRKHIYLRRSSSNKFGAAIWFSRCVGKDERGENKYECLIKFKAMSDAEPLPQQVALRRGSK